MDFLSLCLLTLWLYLPGFLANTFAMMWGKWLPKTGYGPWPIDGGRVMADGNRMLGDGKTWNGLIGGSLTSGLLCMLLASLVSTGDMATAFDDGATVFAHPLIGSEELGFPSVVPTAPPSSWEPSSGLHAWSATAPAPS